MTLSQHSIVFLETRDLKDSFICSFINSFPRHLITASGTVQRTRETAKDKINRGSRHQGPPSVL